MCIEFTNLCRIADWESNQKGRRPEVGWLRTPLLVANLCIRPCNKGDYYMKS